MPENEFASTSSGLDSPGKHAAAVTPSDSVDLAEPARALYIVDAGAVKVTTVGGETLTIPVPANFILPLRVKRVYATGGTTSSQIFAFW